MKFNFTHLTALLMLSTSATMASNHVKVEGDYEYGKTLVESAFGRGCTGCHSIEKFKNASAEEILERITASWHAAGYTHEDIRDISVYLSEEAVSK